jgi:hypothetical protein
MMDSLRADYIQQSHSLRLRIIQSIVASLLKARIVKPAETGLPRQWPSSRHVIPGKEHAIMDAVFSVRSVLRLYKKDQLPDAKTN